MSLQEYTTTMHSEDGVIRHGVNWRGKFDPIAICDDSRDAQRIAEALNNVDVASSSVEHPWNWTDPSKQMPDDDMEVLALTKSERIIPVIHSDGKWRPAYGPIGQCIATASITHWVHPEYPNP